MKTLTVIGLILSINAFGQNCKFKRNELDKFTNQYVKETKSEKVIGTFSTEGLFAVRKVDTAFYFLFDYALSSYSNFDPHKIEKGAKLLFLLEDGSKVESECLDNINGVKKTLVSIPPLYTCYLKNASYRINKNDVNKLFKSKVKTIRFYKTGENGKEDFVDNDIKPRNQDDIQNLIKCLL